MATRKITLTKSTPLMELRCKKCNKLLGKFKHADGEIVCKCGTLNTLNLVSQKVLLTQEQ